MGTGTSSTTTAEDYPPLPPEGGGKLLQGPAFDEDESKESFAQALAAWRNGSSSDNAHNSNDSNDSTTAATAVGTETSTTTSSRAAATSAAATKAAAAKGWNPSAAVVAASVTSTDIQTTPMQSQPKVSARSKNNKKKNTKQNGVERRACSRHGVWCPFIEVHANTDLFVSSSLPIFYLFPPPKYPTSHQPLLLGQLDIKFEDNLSFSERLMLQKKRSSNPPSPKRVPATATAISERSTTTAATTNGDEDGDANDSAAAFDDVDLDADFLQRRIKRVSVSEDASSTQQREPDAQSGGVVIAEITADEEGDEGAATAAVANEPHVLEPLVDEPSDNDDNDDDHDGVGVGDGAARGMGEGGSSVGGVVAYAVDDVADMLAQTQDQQ